MGEGLLYDTGNSVKDTLKKYTKNGTIYVLPQKQVYFDTEIHNSQEAYLEGVQISRIPWSFDTNIPVVKSIK